VQNSFADIWFYKVELIQFPVLGNVKLQGLTPNQFHEQISKALPEK
jgi:hypothetical protein